MDGASAAATVLQLVETGITVSNALYQYGKSVKNANTSCIRLIDDIKLVVNIAHVANHLFSKSPTATVSNELSQYWLTPQSPAIKCKKMLEELQTKMLSGDGGPMKLRAKLRWPFTEAEIKGKIEAFEKYLPYLQLSLQTVHMLRRDMQTTRSRA
ncbi:hypothetical protein F5I97DRAFT_52054 [Phlebopus sp. FC_14]|nr:hypothetical protein F5I97DRAFT_52054 [Phlebopus sp. FC_14]